MKICYMKCRDCGNKGKMDISNYKRGQTYILPECPNCNSRSIEAYEQ